MRLIQYSRSRAIFFHAVSITLFGLMSFPSFAQLLPPLAGIWETCQDPSSSPSGHIQHLFLRFAEDGLYERMVLADDPDKPVSEERGTYEISEAAVVLRYLEEVGGLAAVQTETVPFHLSAKGDTLYWGRDPPVPFTRGREVAPAIYGTWGLLNPVDGTPAGQIHLAPEGRYESDLAGSLEKGRFAVAGSGLVHWPTQTDSPELEGVPGVWTNIQVEGDRLSYDIICSFTVTGVRRAPTLVQAASWGEIKKQTSSR